MFGINRLADADVAGSLANRMRSGRFKLFERLVAPLPRPLRILDVGGTVSFWEIRGWAGRHDVQITILNLQMGRSRHANITFKVGDATAMPELADRSFDIAFSNSVIEHLGTFENQKAMAGELRRVAKAYFAQTPNFWFPLEPHFLIPGWQWLPVSLRVAILRRRTCGWFSRTPDLQCARKVVAEVRLLRRGELRRLFPQATIAAERFFGMNKSWMVYEGFPVKPIPAGGAAPYDVVGGEHGIDPRE